MTLICFGQHVLQCIQSIICTRSACLTFLIGNVFTENTNASFIRLKIMISLLQGNARGILCMHTGIRHAECRYYLGTQEKICTVTLTEKDSGNKCHKSSVIQHGGAQTSDLT